VVDGYDWPDSSVIWVGTWYTSMMLPLRFVKRMGMPEPVNIPGWSFTQVAGQ